MNRNIHFNYLLYNYNPNGETVAINTYVYIYSIYHLAYFEDEEVDEMNQVYQNISDSMALSYFSQFIPVPMGCAVSEELQAGCAGKRKIENFDYVRPMNIDITANDCNDPVITLHRQEPLFTKFSLDGVDYDKEGEWVTIPLEEGEFEINGLNSDFEFEITGYVTEPFCE